MSYDTDISRAILESYSRRLSGHLESDVVVVGAGPAGLACAWRLGQSGLKVTILEKRLAPGGGVWGGAMGMSEVVVESGVVPLLEELGVRHELARKGLAVAGAADLAAALVSAALNANAALFNLTYLEDLMVSSARVAGVVANRTLLGDTLPIDPLAFGAKAVVDATGHEAVAASALARRGLLAGGTGAITGEGPMDAEAAEAFVVEKTGACFPGLYLAGMSACSVYGGPRMGPIFGGMLLSGEKAARLILADLSQRAP